MKNGMCFLPSVFNALIVMFLLLAVSACQKKSNAELDEVKNTTYDLNKNIGWIHNNCLAIKNNEIKSDDKISIVVLGKHQKVVISTIVKKYNSSIGCPQLLDDRKSINISEGNSFYLIKPLSKQIDLGIVLVGKVNNIKEGRELVTVDINRDGKPDYFTECASSEGIHFSVWSEKPWKGKKLWTSYYYLGYDIEPNCP